MPMFMQSMCCCCRFVAAEDSPIHKPLLLVSGSVGGTLAVYEIVIDN